METVEIVVYMTIAIIVGGHVIAFIAGWDPKQTYTGLKRVLGQGPVNDYEEVTSDRLPATIVKLWDGCGLGTTNMTKSVYVTDAALLNKSALFAYFRAASLCKSLQSVAEGCGAREDIVFAGATAPVILRLQCDPTTETLVITS